MGDLEGFDGDYVVGFAKRAIGRIGDTFQRIIIKMPCGMIGKPALAGGKVACPARGLEAWPTVGLRSGPREGSFQSARKPEARFTLEATDRLFARDRDMHTSPRRSQQLARLLGSGTV